MFISIGKWRWPLVIALPVVMVSVLVWRGMVRLRYDARTVLTYSGDPREMDQELMIFQSENARRKMELTFDKIAGQPRQIAIRGHADTSERVVRQLQTGAQVFVDQSLANQKKQIRQLAEILQKQQAESQARMVFLAEERKTFLAAAKRPVPRARMASFGRQVNEAKVRMDYFSRQAQDMARAELALKPAWKVILPAQPQKWPSRVDGWPLGAGVFFGLLLLGGGIFKGEKKIRESAAPNGLWRPDVPVPPTELRVVPSDAELPSDPLTEKAAAIYAKWIEVAKVLYTPAPEPPQGILDSVGPLLQESSEFLPEGHDVMARYLAHTVAPGDLPAHVARTVLMTLTGAAEAGATPEHSLAMALAALFHDLAVVPRPAAIQEEAGSEIGRLSAAVLRRIPGMQPAILSMVEEILIGMDEFKLDTWQNASTGTNLEPLSKVLREIDRFEKVMQKQRARLDRQIIHRQAI